MGDTAPISLDVPSDSPGPFVAKALIVLVGAAAIGSTVRVLLRRRKSQKTDDLVPIPMSSPQRKVIIEKGWESPWKKGQLLGKGTFGSVFRGVHGRTGEPAAIKQMIRGDHSADLEKEFNILYQLPQNPHVVALRALEVEGDQMRLVMEYCAGGTLTGVLREFGPVGEDRLRHYARQILSGLDFLHRHGIAHRDIKPDNILLDSGVPSVGSRLKLSDFGLSRHQESMGSHTDGAGSPCYMSPEAIRGDSGRFAYACDIWSVAATLTELLTGKKPWHHLPANIRNHKVPLMYHIAQPPPTRDASKGHHPQIPRTVSDEAIRFLKRMFELDPARRPSCKELLLDPWLTMHQSDPNEDSTSPLRSPALDQRGQDSAAVSWAYSRAEDANAAEFKTMIAETQTGEG